MTVTRYDFKDYGTIESDGRYVKHEDYVELQRKLEDLVVESAQMLKLLSDISGNHIEYYSEGECGMFAGIPLDYVSEINAHIARDVNAENPFKTTDAALAEKLCQEAGI